ncbi:MAG: hypothetical protein AAF236_03940 [Verrucomicrobiota bacterium]
MRRVFIFLLTSGLSLWCSLQSAERVLDESNSWPFVQKPDPFSDEALLDLRHLNEATSGESGFIRTSEDGNSLVRGDGEPIRFWAVGTDAWKFTPAQMDEHCRWLAKLGVNLTRLHVTIVNRSEGDSIDDLDLEMIEGCHRFIAAAKAAGIYVLISPYYAHFDIPESWGLLGGKQPAVGALFVDPYLQAAYREWTRRFYTMENPHTGLPIAKDPTVAFLQVQNEDSLFFWASQRMAEPQKLRLAEHFSKWLAEHYGSVGEAFASWGETRPHDHDDREAGIAGVFDIFFLTQDWEGGMEKRIRDQTEFLGTFQRDFYAEMGRHLRETVGCEQLLNATNWRTANDGRLKAIERWTYQALDFEAENEYVGSDFQHQGENDHFRIDPGHYLVNESVLPKPFEMSTNWKQGVGFPFIATETAWKNPNRYQSEGPFLIAAYQSLNGVDGICWFSCQTPRYETDPLRPYWRMPDGQLAMHKWNICYPAVMAGFPANALLYRRGDLTEAPPVVIESRPLSKIWRREVPRITDDETYGDQRELPDLAPGWTAETDEINRAAFLIGPVRSAITEAAQPDQISDLSNYFDPEAGEIKSTTEQLIWDYRDEVCKMNAPRAQGVTGFLARNGGQFTLSDCIITSTNKYATINLVSLDEAPLSESTKILLQVVTVNRLTGYQTEDATFQVGKGDNAYEVDGERILQLGRPPWRIANSEVTVEIDNEQLNKATVLDMEGYPVETSDIEGTFTVPTDAIYVILHTSDIEVEK